ncbi:MAG TPA: hypothetical protein VMT19_04660 [Thermoanaerobaculaceae bacterium]|nr:hypothetical protein [Thermoanaerobaculaceae bacterium]
MTLTADNCLPKRSRCSYVMAALGAWGLAVGFLVASLLLAHGGEPLDMIRPPNRGRANQSYGFDGQFFFALAKDPSLRPQTVALLDAPVIRARRIGFPLAAWLLSPVTGGPAYAMLVVLALSSAATVWILQAIAERNGSHPALILSVPLALPLALSMELVTCELTASALLVAAVAAERCRKPLPATILLGLACLTKEVIAVAILSFVISAALTRRFARAAAYATAIVPLALWQVYLASHLGLRTEGGSLLANLTVPCTGLLGEFGAAVAYLLAGVNAAKASGLVMALLWTLAGAVLSLRLVIGKRTPGRVLALGGTLLALMLARGAPAFAYDEIFNFGRQLFILPIGLIVVLFIEYRELSPRGRAALAFWLVVGTALGAAWWTQKIWVLSQVPGVLG